MQSEDRKPTYNTLFQLIGAAAVCYGVLQALAWWSYWHPRPAEVTVRLDSQACVAINGEMRNRSCVVSGRYSVHPWTNNLVMRQDNGVTVELPDWVSIAVPVDHSR